MICPKCNTEMEEITELSFGCDNCYENIILCRICKLPNKDLNSDICGHPACIERKMRFMWKPEVEKKTRRERNKNV